jgi:hypothetical protein
MTRIKYIKNPPTVEELENLYFSPTYQNLLMNFARITKRNFYEGLEDRTVLRNILGYAKRHYLILNLPIEQVVIEFERLKEQLLHFTISSFDYFDKNPNDIDGEFPEGEEQGEQEKSVVIETLGLSKTFLLDRFCELYLLQTGDKELLANFLKLTRTPFAKKYQGQLNKIYKQVDKK